MKFRPEYIILILIVGAIGALGGAGYSCSIFRISQFDIEVDADTLRSQPLINLLETFNGRLFTSVTTSELCDDISAFKQVERVTIERMGFTGFKVNIALRHPLLMVTNGIERICLGPAGTPFPYWPEHGELPLFTIQENLTRTQMLNPDSAIRDFYFIALSIVSHSLNNLSSFSTFAGNDEYEIQLADRTNSRLLRLPRIYLRDPASSLIGVNTWLQKNSEAESNKIFDARFPGTLIEKPIRKGIAHV